MSWRLWWEYNREHLTGMRGLLRRAVTTTGTPGKTARDPLGKRRDEVLAALRRTVADAGNRTLRAAALIALGRMGGDEDVDLFLRLLRDRRQPQDVGEAAAVALGVLPPLGSDASSAARDYLAGVIRDPNALTGRTRGLALLSAGLRGRHDPLLAMRLLGRATASGYDSEEAGNLALACGLAGNRIAVPELLQAARMGRLARKRLTDVGRSHATQALGRTGDPVVPRALCNVLRSRRSGLQTKRGAALALARALRETQLAAEDRQRAERALARAFEKENDPALLGFVALALGGARQPAAIPALIRAVDAGGKAAIKPYCALALGLAARTLDDARIRSFLAREARKARALELRSALLIALGLAGAKDAELLLLDHVRKKSLPVSIRGAAAQGLGLLGPCSPGTARALEEQIFKERSAELLQDLVLALGLMGRRGVAGELAVMLPRANSTMLKGRIILALGHLGHAGAIDPLLELLGDGRAQPLVREFAAVALGLMGDRRDRDPLFEVDAYFNYFATTLATNELIRLY